MVATSGASPGTLNRMSTNALCGTAGSADFSLADVMAAGNRNALGEREAVRLREFCTDRQMQVEFVRAWDGPGYAGAALNGRFMVLGLGADIYSLVDAHCPDGDLCWHHEFHSLDALLQEAGSMIARRLN